jgi:SAM-dependent methyltransferase
LPPINFLAFFEFGCGLARVTIPLARRFGQVFACDVSRTHLAQAKLAVSESGATNIRLIPATLPDFGMAEPFDLWFSRLVLQHNTPPLIAMILQRALQMLSPGGLAVFQVPTYAIGYQFRIADYLASPPAADHFEMHVLPQQALFEIAVQSGCSVQEVREDVSTGSSNWISNWIVLRKFN